jgi:uncharacterized OB-fold protein
MSTADAFPYPIPEFGTEAYWEAANHGELRVQRCLDCGRLRWQPAPLCLDCQSERHEWALLSGRGRIHTWTEITHPVHPAAFAKVPYLVVEIELEEQADLRMISNLVGTTAAAVSIGAPVVVDFATHPNGQRLPVFRLTG